MDGMSHKSYVSEIKYPSEILLAKHTLALFQRILLFASVGCFTFISLPGFPELNWKLPLMLLISSP